MKKVIVMMIAVISMVATFAMPKTSFAEMSDDICECVVEICEIRGEN